jgi:tetratricopeptide (TPR) repeat protein
MALNGIPVYINEKGVGLEHIAKYLQNQDYVNQIDLSVRETGSNNAAISKIISYEIQQSINASGQNTEEAILRSSDSIRESIEIGFSDLNNAIGIGFSIMLETQRITNILLEEVKDLLRISDRQKDRIYFIEEGMKFFLAGGKKPLTHEYYSKALDKFKKSLAIEEDDFFSHYYIGFIQLYTPKNLNYSFAEKSFKKAAYFLVVEAEVGGTNVSRNIKRSSVNFWLEAKKAYLHAAHACYKQGKMSEAVLLAEEAGKSYPDSADSYFMQSKYLLLDNKIEKAVIILEKAIRQNPNCYVYAGGDEDLGKEPQIIFLLERFFDTLMNEVIAKLNFWDKTISQHPRKSMTLSQFNRTKEKIQDISYLKLIKLKESLLVSSQWTLEEGAVIKNGKVVPEISKLQFVGTVIEFAVFELECVLAIPIARKLKDINKIILRKEPILHDIGILNDEAKRKKTGMVGSVVMLIVSLITICLCQYFAGVYGDWLHGLFMLMIFLLQLSIVFASFASIVWLIR